MTNSTDIIGLDPGSSGLRIAGADDCIAVSANISVPTGLRLSGVAGLAHTEPPPLIEFASLAYYVGRNASLHGRAVTNLDLSRQTGTPEMRAMLYAALTEWAEAGHDLDGLSVMVALPNEVMAVDETTAAAKRWLVGDHAWLCNGRPYAASIRQVWAVGQAVAAMFDYLLDNDGQWVDGRRAEFAQRIGVVSLGFGTLELTAVQGRAQAPGLTFGPDLGARRLAELLDPRREYSPADMEERIRLSPASIPAEAREAWHSDVVGGIDKAWGKQWRTFRRVVVVGGGVHLIGKQVYSYFAPLAWMPDAPELAVARGAGKFARATRRKGA